LTEGQCEHEPDAAISQDKTYLEKSSKVSNEDCCSAQELPLKLGLGENIEIEKMPSYELVSKVRMGHRNSNKFANFYSHKGIVRQPFPFAYGCCHL